ncbi:hypothetical protein BJY04DRAFT_56245 [Aspergillus karnatakaensis]|uniref:uncharacterized protein n=1 Tax=Aspergillus karnatakaensis TaxID=1810916 RepID=UPI003CCD21CA
MSERSSAASSPMSSGWSGDSEVSSPDSDYSGVSQPSEYVAPKPKPLPARAASVESSKPKTFMFVDTQADKPYNSTVRRQKQAFLLKKYHKEKREASISRLKATKLPTKAEAPPKPAASKIPAPASDKGIKEEDEISDTAIITTAAKNPWPVQIQLGQGVADPFNTYAVQMTDMNHMYLEHFRIHGIAAANPLSTTLVGKFMFKNAVATPALLNIFMFFSARHIALMESKNGVDPACVRKSITSSLRARGDALESLNKVLRDPKGGVTELSIIIVASFVTIESSMGNSDAVRAHLQGLKKLVDLIGGLDVISHMTLSKLYQCDGKAALLLGTQPIFIMSPRWRNAIVFGSEVFNPTHPSSKPPAALSALGHRFNTSSWRTELNRTMLSSIEIFRRLILYYEMATQQPELGMMTDNDLLIAAEHQLHALDFSGDNNLNEPMRLSLLVYLSIRIWHLAGLPMMFNIVVNLRNSLEPQLPSFQAIAPDLVFWMLFMGGMGSLAESGRSWYVERLSEMRTLLWIEDWAQARSILGEFFYTNQLGQTGGEDLWDEVILTGASYMTYIAPDGVEGDFDAFGSGFIGDLPIRSGW